MEVRGRRQTAGVVNYSDKGPITGSGTPLWLKSTSLTAEVPVEKNENAPHNSKAVRKAVGKPAPAQRGRNAGVSVVPIADHKQERKIVAPTGQQSRSSSEDQPAGAGKEPREVPGLPGVVQKPAAPKAAVTRPSGQSGPAAERSRPKPAAAKRKQSMAQLKAAEHELLADPAKLTDPSARREEQQQEEQAGKRQRPSTAPAAAAKRQAPAVAAPRQAPAAPAPSDMPAAMMLEAAASPMASLSSANADQLVEHYSRNFQALQAEYERLQQQYEDLKIAKIDEEVQQLLELHNKYVSDHGAKAAELAHHWRLEAERHEGLARELGGEEAVQRTQQLQVDLLAAQQGLLDLEAASIDRDKQIAELERRNMFLERHARIPLLTDKCVQTEDLAMASAGNQAPSLEPSAIEMLEARALLPEGAAGGSIYRRLTLQRRDVAGAGGVDASYTLPPSSMQLPATHDASAGPAAAAAEDPAELECGPPSPPRITLSSDMQITGSKPVLQGRLGHAALARAPRPGSGLTAESVLPPAQDPRPGARLPSPVAMLAGQPQLVMAGPVVRRASLAAAVAAPRIEKQLHFPSASITSGRQASMVVVGARTQLSPVPSAAVQHLQQQQASLQQVPAASVRPAASPLPADHSPLLRVVSAMPSSGPLAPRSQALKALMGLDATPMKHGWYKYIEPISGFTFEFGPASPGWAGSDDDDELAFRPVELGNAAAVVPQYMQCPIVFAKSEQANFMNKLLAVLAQAARLG